MKIGVIGAPETGKSEFARRLKNRLDEDVFIIDDYVQKLQEETGLVLGPYAAQHEHYMIAGVRLAEEAKHAKDNTITVGTIIDTLTYSLILGGASLSGDNYNNQEFLEAKAAVEGLALIYGHTWDYNVTFYLPTDSSAVFWQRRLDKNLQDVVNSFLVESVFLLEGSEEERLDIATRIIKELKENPSPDATEVAEAE